MLVILRLLCISPVGINLDFECSKYYIELIKDGLYFNSLKNVSQVNMSVILNTYIELFKTISYIWWLITIITQNIFVVFMDIRELKWKECIIGFKRFHFLVVDIDYAVVFTLDITTYDNVDSSILNSPASNEYKEIKLGVRWQIQFYVIFPRKLFD